MNIIRISIFIFILVLLQIFSVEALLNKKGSVHTCVQATLALSTTGDGTSPDSCAGCDPALETCTPGCQAYIDKVYYQCDSVCLPDGYYFDPRKALCSFFPFLFLNCFLFSPLFILHRE